MTAKMSIRGNEVYYIEKRFVVQEDVNTEHIILLIDCERMWMYSFLAEEKEAVDKICDLLNEQQEYITHLEGTNDNFRISVIEDIEAMEQAEKKINEQQDTINELQRILFKEKLGL